ncbi:hypothetical protein BDR26DRAFT_858629 [Obelidium mucronatum]|nr:hypothetical protein BDR26DRAFT_858629 [Obelidium mucronatum]
MITTPTSLLLYQQTFRLAAKQLRVFIASHGQEYVTKSNRTMVKNSLLMTTSILLLYSPQIIAFYFLPMDPQIGENEINIRMSVIVFVNVLAGLDPIVTAVLVLYFARDVRIYLHKMVFFWRNTED